MTHAEIDALPAGRGLDALILCDVLDWKRAGAMVDQSEYWVNANGEYVRSGGDIPRFSTDIAAAWQVWEILIKRCSDRDVPVNIGYFGPLNELGDCWIVYDGNEGPAEASLIATALTAPLAICRAALKATLQAE